MEYFDISNSLKNPYEQFAEWYREVEKSGRENYNAVALSTSARNGSVSSRIVLLKEFDHSGFVFYTNYNSRKGRQISINPSGAMLFYWPEFRRQVRIEGVIARTDAEESDNYFNSRIRGHKLNALASDQSSVIESRQNLLEIKNRLDVQYRDSEPSRPDYWGGYRLVPNMFEFWQEGTDRFHDRLEYLATSHGWTINRLAP